MPGLDGVAIPGITAALLRERMQAGGVSVVDVDSSRDYRAGHIPGAWYGIRARLAEIVDANGFTVMPGLIDTHVHLDILGHGDYPTWHGMVRENYAEVMELAAAQLLRHGVTTARDAGGVSD